MMHASCLPLPPAFLPFRNPLPSPYRCRPRPQLLMELQATGTPLEYELLLRALEPISASEIALRRVRLLALRVTEASERNVRSRDRRIARISGRTPARKSKSLWCAGTDGADPAPAAAHASDAEAAGATFSPGPSMSPREGVDEPGPTAERSRSSTRKSGAAVVAGGAGVLQVAASTLQGAVKLKRLRRDFTEPDLALALSRSEGSQDALSPSLWVDSSLQTLARILETFDHAKLQARAEASGFGSSPSRPRAPRDNITPPARVAHSHGCHRRCTFPWMPQALQTCILARLEGLCFVRFKRSDAYKNLLSSSRPRTASSARRAAGAPRRRVGSAATSSCRSSVHCRGSVCSDNAPSEAAADTSGRSDWRRASQAVGGAVDVVVSDVVGAAQRIQRFFKGRHSRGEGVSEEALAAASEQTARLATLQEQDVSVSQPPKKKPVSKNLSDATYLHAVKKKASEVGTEHDGALPGGVCGQMISLSEGKVIEMCRERREQLLQ